MWLFLFHLKYLPHPHPTPAQDSVLACILSGVKFSVYLILVSNSRQISCLRFLGMGITGMNYPAHLVVLINFSESLFFCL